MDAESFGSAVTETLGKSKGCEKVSAPPVAQTSLTIKFLGHRARKLFRTTVRITLGKSKGFWKVPERTAFRNFLHPKSAALPATYRPDMPSPAKVFDKFQMNFY